MRVVKRPTLRDVAEVARVSIKTVSRVVNDEGGVSEPLAARVRAAVEELGYEPDHRARQLRQREPAVTTIGCLVDDIANPFFGSLLRGVEEVAVSRHCLVVVASTGGSRVREGSLAQAFVRRRLDGLIVVPIALPDGALRGEIDRGRPVVFADLQAKGAPTVDVVRTDHVEGARRATEHLLSHGHADVAFLGDDPAVFSARERLRGYREAMASAGAQVRPHLVVTARDDEQGWFQRALELLRTASPPTAIFSAQNYVTVGVARARHHLGVQRQIAQVGFDDMPLADVVDPPLSLVPQDPRGIGRLAAEVLFQRIDGDSSPARTHLLPVDVIVRGSGEIHPAG